MNNQPLLTDRQALARNRARMTATFMLETVADEFHERLNEVNRTFTDAAVVSGNPEFWGDQFPNAAQVADSDTLDLKPQSRDLVIHAMALHWANDPVGQIIQSHRALRSDGLFLAALFGGQTLHELRTVLAEAESRVTGGLSPRIAPMGEIRDVGALLQRCNLALPVADAVPFTVSYQDAWALMRDLRAMGEANALNARHRAPTRRKVFETAADLYQQHFGTEDGRITATFEVIFLAGWAPDESQQKPLRPGSAKFSLAEALNAAKGPVNQSDN